MDVDEGSTSAGETLSGEGNWFSFKSVEFGENGLKSIRMNLAGNGNNDLPPIKVYIDDRTKEENLIGTIQQRRQAVGITLSPSRRRLRRP